MMKDREYMIEYREIKISEIDRRLFSGFIRHQKVVKCRWKSGGRWIIADDPFTDDWSEPDYEKLILFLKENSVRGGLVFGAFAGNVLKGFISVKPGLFGGDRKYIDLSEIHVSEDLRRTGIGKVLFERAKDWAKQKGADYLYISAHSAVESQAFYAKMGCADALYPDKAHVEAEPFDCQLECRL